MIEATNLCGQLRGWNNGLMVAGAKGTFSGVVYFMTSSTS
jgi:hypothetical protein